jgi:hypothetical protein
VLQLAPAAGIVGLEALRAAATTELNQVILLVRAALQARYDAAKKPGESYVWFDIEALFPDRAIVCKDGRYWQFAYAIDAANQVKLEEPVEVIEQFTPVKEAVVLTAGSGAGLAALIEAIGDSEGKVWDVVICRAGLSKNGMYYPDATLREAVHLFDGARVYVKPDELHVTKNEKNPEKLFGWLSEVKFVEGKSSDTGHLAGKLNVGAQFKELRETIVDAWKRGKRDLVGLSINAIGKVARALREGYKRAQSIVKVESVDLIIDPAAGGGLVRMVEAADPKENDSVLREAMLAKILAAFPTFDATKLPEDQLLVKYAEALAADKPAPKPDDKAGEPMTREEFNQAMRLVEARAAARAKIERCGLPAPAITKLLDWANRQDNEHLTEAAVDATVKAEREYLARMTESGHVRLGDLDVVTVEDRAKKVADMLDAFFDPEHKEHRKVRSFREAYIDVTGDRRVTGRIENCDTRRMSESLGVLRESLDSGSWSNVLGNAITRRLVGDYRRPNQYDIWRRVASVANVNDFRTNERTRFGGYGDLPAVAQGAAYLALTSPTDEKATYAVSKRGGTEDITLEMIKNDDVGSIRQIPIKLSRSAKRTLAKFVLDFIRTNPTLYDSVAFFHATHANLGSLALDAASLAAARLRMLKQTEAGSSDRLGIGPSTLLVPPDAQETAVNLFNRNTNLDKTFVNSMSLEILPVWYWTDVNDWAIGADKDELPSIEIGFLDGNEEPELFVQDNPTVGSLFTNDKVTYKIRFIFGGNVINFRGFDKSVVA